MDAEPQAASRIPAYPGNLVDGPPDSMPELAREITMARGAFACLESRANELLAKLTPVQRMVEPSPERATMADDAMPVNTPAGQEIRALTRAIGALEHRIGQAEMLLEV